MQTLYHAYFGITFPLTRGSRTVKHMKF